MKTKWFRIANCTDALEFYNRTVANDVEWPDPLRDIICDNTSVVHCGSGWMHFGVTEDNLAVMLYGHTDACMTLSELRGQFPIASDVKIKDVTYVNYWGASSVPCPPFTVKSKRFNHITTVTQTTVSGVVVDGGFVSYKDLYNLYDYIPDRMSKNRTEPCCASVATHEI